MSCMIYEVWDELIAALPAIAPQYQQLFKPPAIENDLRKLEEGLKVALPRDYREFLKIHDGCHNNRLLFAFSFFSVEEIASRTQEVREYFREASRSFTDGGWDSQKLMIGDSYVGWSLAIDCVSAAPFIYAQNNYALSLAGSFSDYLIGLKDNLRDGNYQVVKGEIFMDEWGRRF